MLAFIANVLLDLNLFGIVMRALYITVTSSVIALSMSVFVFSVTALSRVFNLVSQFLSLISGSGVSSHSVDLGLFYSLLNAIGFTPALNASMPLIYSAVSFVFLRILYVYSTSAYFRLVDYLATILK